MGSLDSRLRVVFVLLFLFVLGLHPVHAVDVDDVLDSRIGVGSGVLEEQAYLENSGEDFVDGVENTGKNNVDSGSLDSSDAVNSDSSLDSALDSDNNTDLFDVGSVSSLVSVSSGVPSVLGFSVSGDFDRSKTGVGFYRNVRIQVTGENFTGDNFLSKEGLHWSNKTRVEPITARKLGLLMIL